MARDYDTAVNIPVGKHLKIFIGTPSDEKKEIVDLILDDEITFSIGSSYTTVVGGDNSSLQSIMAMLAGNLWDTLGGWLGGNSKLGYQVFSGGKPLTLSLNCRLMAITDAFKDVVSKVRTLQLLTVPKEDDEGFLKVLPGLDPIEQITGDSNEINGLTEDVHNTKWGYIKIGNLSFYGVIFKEVSVTYSTDTDQTGYPISAKVSLDIETSRIVTEKTIDWLYNTNSESVQVSEKSVFDW